MKKIFFFSFFIFSTLCFAQKNTLFDDTKVPSIFVTINKDSLDILLDDNNSQSLHYFAAQFIFDDNLKKDTLLDIGLRLRGSSSRFAKKKSYKISFNAFSAGRKYQNIKKLNLIACQNDPSMIREKLYYDIWNKTNSTIRRCNFIRLYINQIYKGLYTNVEELDNDWLKNIYGEDKGNFFKCTTGADLRYYDNNPNTYKNLQNNPLTPRVYDLTTNQKADDYSDLAVLITQINEPIDTNFGKNLEKLLDVESVINAYSINVAVGNWDSYAFNGNNYYLYNNPKRQQFEFMAYDTDNCMGIDFYDIDWTKRPYDNWAKENEDRPLISKILAIPTYKKKLLKKLEYISKYITQPDTIFPRIDFLHNLIKNAALDDDEKSLDWNYSDADWENSFTQQIDKHSPFGIKPFFAERYKNTIKQIGNINLDTEKSIFIFPNPASSHLSIFSPAPTEKILIFNSQGALIFKTTANEKEIDVSNFAAGCYFIQIFSSEKIMLKKWVKI